MGNISVHNGVSFDFDKNLMTYRGKFLVMTRDRILLIRALAKVMPSLLPSATVAASIWKNTMHSTERLRVLVSATNIELRDKGVELEIREVPKMGYVLASTAQAEKSAPAGSGDNEDNRPSDGRVGDAGVLLDSMKEKNDDNPTTAEGAPA